MARKHKKKRLAKAMESAGAMTAPEIRPSATSEAQRKQDLYVRLRSWFELELMRQQVNRFQQALDCDYYDGIQWQAAEAAKVRARGQAPIVYNEVKPTLDWLIGTERRTRRDFKVLARYNKSQEASADAEIKTRYLKYLEDVQRAPFVRSQAFDDQIKAGLGWLEVGVTADPEDDPIYMRAESWRNMLHDSISAINSPDPNDWRYLFRFKEVDLDIAERYFPDNIEELQRASTMGEWRGPMDEDWAGAWPAGNASQPEGLPMRWMDYNPDADAWNPRRRVSLVECWYREPTRETTGQGASSQDRVRMKVRVAMFTKHDLLMDIESPYAHNRFPFVPLWCYRRKSDGMPYGVIRNVRGPQDGLNKRMSKAQFLLSVNQAVVEEGAIDEAVMDMEDIRHELAAPDGIAVFAKGALSGQKVQLRNGLDIAQGHLALAETDRTAVRSVSGVTMENRGMSGNGQSGKAIIAKQDQGSMVTAEPFDNLMLAHQMEGELKVSLIEQYVTDEKTFSVTGERYKLDYYTMNGRDPVTGVMVNDVTAFKAAFVIGEAPWRQALAEANFEAAMTMMGQLAQAAPQVVVSILDLVFEWGDFPNKAAILQRIRSVTGVADPDKGETPEQQAAQKQKAAVAKAQFEAQMAQLQATIAEAQAKGEKLSAEAMAKRLEALYMAAQAAQVLTMAPQIAPVADELARSVGFKDQAGDAALGGPVPTQQTQPVPQPMQADGALAGAQAGIESPAISGVEQGVIQ